MVVWQHDKGGSEGATFCSEGGEAPRRVGPAVFERSNSQDRFATKTRQGSRSRCDGEWVHGRSLGVSEHMPGR